MPEWSLFRLPQRSGGQWQRTSGFVVIPEFVKTGKSVSRVLASSEARPMVTRFVSERGNYERELARIAGQSASLAPEEVSKAMREAKTRYDEFLQSDEFVEIRQSVVEAYTKSYPIGERIVIQAVTNARKDPDALVYDVAAAALSGGGTVVPALGMRAVDASLDVLAEEGVVTKEEAELVKGMGALIRGLDGVKSADSVLATVRAVKDTYEGLVECGIVKEESGNGRVKVRLRTAGRALDLVVLLAE